jgi:hypothetical protein
MRFLALSVLAVLTTAAPASAADTTRSFPLDNPSAVIPHEVVVASDTYLGGESLQVQPDDQPRRGQDRPSFAYLPGIDFHDGTIEVDVASTVLPNAPASVRGFIGVAFRIDPTQDFACEGFYIRPTNGRADDQVRRNHSTQYFSYPGWTFERFRREAPERYESYADLTQGAWTHLRIDVAGATARLFVGDAKQPVLIVNDLKHGADAHGTIGLWVGVGTLGRFRNLIVTQR